MVPGRAIGMVSRVLRVRTFGIAVMGRLGGLIGRGLRREDVRRIRGRLVRPGGIVTAIGKIGTAIGKIGTAIGKIGTAIGKIVVGDLTEIVVGSIAIVGRGAIVARMMGANVVRGDAETRASADTVNRVLAEIAGRGRSIGMVGAPMVQVVPIAAPGRDVARGSIPGMIADATGRTARGTIDRATTIVVRRGTGTIGGKVFHGGTNGAIAETIGVTNGRPGVRRTMKSVH